MCLTRGVQVATTWCHVDSVVFMWVPIFWIHEWYRMIYGHVLHPLSYGALYMAQQSLNTVLRWRVHSSTTAIRVLYCYQEHSHGPCFYTFSNHWTLLCVLCCIFFSWICFHQIQPPFLLDLISHNCFRCSPEPHSCKTESTCFEFSHLGCTHLWPLMVPSSLS